MRVPLLLGADVQPKIAKAPACDGPHHTREMVIWCWEAPGILLTRHQIANPAQGAKLTSCSAYRQLGRASLRILPLKGRRAAHRPHKKTSWLRLNALRAWYADSETHHSRRNRTLSSRSYGPLRCFGSASNIGRQEVQPQMGRRGVSSILPA